MLSALKMAVAAAGQRVVAARMCWQIFDELNHDHWFVSWCISLAGAKLPAESLVKAAEQAYEKFNSAVLSKDFKKIAVELKAAETSINAAYKAIMDYKTATIKRAEKQANFLEFTRDTSFEIVTAIATVEMGGTYAAYAGAGGAGALVKSAANELGEYLAGTSEGTASAAKNIICDGVLGAASGSANGLLKLKGDKIIEGVAESVAKKNRGKVDRWFGCREG